MAESLYRRIATPCYVYDCDVFAQRVSAVKAAFGAGVKLCYSMKANPFLLAALPSDFENIEVCSPGELTICENMGVNMSSVIFSGVNKTENDVRRAMADGVGVFTAESIKHLHLINAEALSTGKRAKLLLRIAKDTQFGMDEAQVREVIAQRDAYHGVEIVGVHYFTGTQKRKVKETVRECEYLTAFVESVKQELGFTLQRIEYGAGLAADYFDADADTTELERLNDAAPYIRQLSGCAALTVEMGRFFAAPCGTYYTAVEDVKSNSGVNYAICDGGIHQVNYYGQLQGMHIPVIEHYPDRNEEIEATPWTVCGSLCTTADVLARNVMLRGLKEGDVLAFRRVGAYSVMEAMTTFLSRDTASVYMKSEAKGLRMVRAAAYTDVWNMPREDKTIE